VLLKSGRGGAIVIGMRLLRLSWVGGLEIIGVVRLAEMQAGSRRVAISVAAPGSGAALSHEAAVLREVRQPRCDPLPLTGSSPFE
jgi:hypothetical protein